MVVVIGLSAIVTTLAGVTAKTPIAFIAILTMAVHCVDRFCSGQEVDESRTLTWVLPGATPVIERVGPDNPETEISAFATLLSGGIRML